MSEVKQYLLSTHAIQYCKCQECVAGRLQATVEQILEVLKAIQEGKCST